MKTAKDLVTSFELSRDLVDNGFLKPSFFQWEVKMGKPWIVWRDYHWHPSPDTSDLRYYYPAYTADELAQYIPEYVSVGFQNIPITFRKRDTRFLGHIRGIYQPSSTNEADVRAKMLIYLIKAEML